MTNLTEQWEKGELPEGEYYYKLDGEIGTGTKGGLDIFELYSDEARKEEIEILAPVLSYDDFMCLVSAYNNVTDENEKLKEQYNRAKWWLKEIVENHRFTPISTAEKALKELEELEK